MGSRSIKWSRPLELRELLKKNILTSLVRQERIITTITRAKNLKPIAEKLITLGKKGTPAAEKTISKMLADDIVKPKVLTELAQRYAERAGGYVRVLRLHNRKFDSAPMGLIEFVDNPIGPSPIEGSFSYEHDPRVAVPPKWMKPTLSKFPGGWYARTKKESHGMVEHLAVQDIVERKEMHKPPAVSIKPPVGQWQEHAWNQRRRKERFTKMNELSLGI